MISISYLHVGKPIRIKTKWIMLVGATGSGKSTLANALANYVIGVRREDCCRFEMVKLEDNEQGRSGVRYMYTSCFYLLFCGIFFASSAGGFGFEDLKMYI